MMEKKDSIRQFDQRMMDRAVRIARTNFGRTFPNPKVGCVIVKNNRVIGEGFHRKAGSAHAEIEAMNCCKSGSLAGATCYVTLEPCHHYGKTPPCTEALLRAGIQRVVYGMDDPNPHVTGGGASFLKNRGISVDGPLLTNGVLNLHKAWAKRISTGMPWVTIKMAASLDGKTATCSGETRWISNEDARRYVHKLRAESDAIMAGVQTVIADNPELTARHAGKIIAAPVRIIVDSHLRCPAESRVFSSELPGSSMTVCTDQALKDRREQFLAKKVRVVTTKSDRGRVDLEELLPILASEGIESIWVEGGATLVFSLLEKQLVDEICFMYSNKILGGIEAPGMVGGHGFPEIKTAPDLKRFKIIRIKDNFMITGFLREPWNVHRHSTGSRGN